MTVNGASAIAGCPNCGSDTKLLGVNQGTTVRKCGNCNTVVHHTPPAPEPGQHGYSRWDPQQVLSNEFG